MELQLVDPRARWQKTDHTTPLRLGEIPFSIEALNSFRNNRDGTLEKRETALIMPPHHDMQHYGDTWFPPPPTENRTRKQHRLAAAYERDECCDRAFKIGQWLLLGLAICFVAVVITLLSMVFVKVGQLLDSVGGSGTTGMQAKFDAVLNHALDAAANTEAATANAASMTAVAKSAVVAAQPRLIDALNESSEILHELRDFSAHPMFTLSASSRRRRD